MEEIVKSKSKIVLAINKIDKIEKQKITAYEPMPIELSSSIGESLSISDGKYIIIGSDISRIRIIASMQFVSSEVKQHNMLIRLLRDGAISTLATANVYGLNSSVEKVIYQYVRKGDKIFVSSNTDTVVNSATTGGSRSGIIVEKIA